MKQKKPTEKVWKVKGRSICVKRRSHVGTVVSTKMQKSVVVEWERRVFVPKFERYLKRRTKVHARVPEDIEVEEGDKVRIHACRPISKTINFIVMENLGKEKNYEVKKEAREEAQPIKEEVEDESA